MDNADQLLMSKHTEHAANREVLYRSVGVVVAVTGSLACSVILVSHE